MNLSTTKALLKMCVFSIWRMLVSRRPITLPKKTSEVEVCTWGSQLFGSSYRKAVQPMVHVNGKLLVTGACFPIFFRRRWRGPKVCFFGFRQSEANTLESCWQVSTSKLPKMQTVPWCFSFFKGDRWGRYVQGGPRIRKNKSGCNS